MTGTASRRAGSSPDRLSDEEWEMIHYLRGKRIDSVEKLEIFTDPELVLERVAGVIEVKLKEQSLKRQGRQK